jgi:hypothetical protein
MTRPQPKQAVAAAQAADVAVLAAGSVATPKRPPMDLKRLASTLSFTFHRIRRMSF